MASVGQWADHRELATDLEDCHLDEEFSLTDATKASIAQAAAALRDLGDRLDMLTADNAKLERACKAIGRAAYEECARLLDEAADCICSRHEMHKLAAKFRQLAEGGKSA